MSNILNIKNQFPPSMSNRKTLFSGFLYFASKTEDTPRGKSGYVCNWVTSFLK